MIVTRKARILLIMATLSALLGLVRYNAFLVHFGVATVIWIGLEWLLFRFRVLRMRHWMSVSRTVLDRSGPARVLWKGRPTRVRIDMRFRPCLRWLPATLLTVEDIVPPGARSESPDSAGLELTVGGAQRHEISYGLATEMVGAIRFSGLRCLLEDQTGLFFAERFLEADQMLRVLPISFQLDSPQSTRKPRNAMPPPGIHTIARAGSGSELLDIRDYVPGDPPKSVAWKVSARRDSLMTKQFETEVPVRCQMFVDMARRVRLGYPGPCLAERMVEILSSVSQLLISHRDVVGLSIFDGHDVSISRPSANRRSYLQMTDRLAKAMDRPIAPVSASTEGLLEAAYDMARLRYPEAMYYSMEGFRGRIVPRGKTRRMRETLATLIVAYYGLDEWAVGELAMDNRQLSYWLQRFLADHRVPYAGRRFDDHGHYLFDDAAKIPQLARLISHASARSRDSELFLVFAELCDVAYDLGPLLHATKLAIARQHRVAFLCAWPTTMPADGEAPSLDTFLSVEATADWAKQLERRQRLHAYQRLRSEMARLRVPVALASEEQAVPLVVAQLNLVRSRRTVA